MDDNPRRQHVQRPALTKERGIKEQDDYFEELGLDVSSNLPTNHMIPVKTAGSALTFNATLTYLDCLAG